MTQNDPLAVAKWPVAPADRYVAQAEGKHPAPCARFCEANAFEIELRSVKIQLATSQAREQRLREALEKAHRANSGRCVECGSYTHFDSCLVRNALATPSDTTALNAWGAKLLRDASKHIAEEYSAPYSADYLQRKADELMKGRT